MGNSGGDFSADEEFVDIEKTLGDDLSLLFERRSFTPPDCIVVFPRLAVIIVSG